MDDYSRGGHSKYSMKVHIIFVTKYSMDIPLSKWKQTKTMYIFCWNIALKCPYLILLSNSNNIVRIRCGSITGNICLNDIGNIGFYGQMDILPAVLVKFHKRLSKSISKTKDNGNGRRVSTRLKACGLTAENL